MSHCYSVKAEGKEICTIVPGNEKLRGDVIAAEQTGGKKPNPTKEEIDRAIKFFEDTGGVNTPGRMHESQHPWGGPF